jgi:hypothetical protein
VSGLVESRPVTQVETRPLLGGRRAGRATHQKNGIRAIEFVLATAAEAAIALATSFRSAEPMAPQGWNFDSSSIG